MESYPSEESLYATIFKGSAESILNSAFDYREDLVGYETSTSGFEPQMASARVEADVDANHHPQYVNCQSAHTRSNTASSSTAGNEKQQLQQHDSTINGRQLKQNEYVSEASTSYNSCNEVVRSENSIRNITVQSFIPIDTNQDGGDDKGGYVQPIEVFSPSRVRDTPSFDMGTANTTSITTTATTTTHNSRSGATREQGGSGILQPDLQDGEGGYISPSDAPVNFDFRVVSDNTTGSSNENPYTATPKAARRGLQRFDSGVVDCDPNKDTSSLSATQSNPTPFRDRLSTYIEQHYEDIDAYRIEKKDAIPRASNNCAKVNATKSGADSMAVSIELPSRLQRSKRPSTEQDNVQPVMLEVTTADPSCPVLPLTTRRPSSPRHNPYTPVDMETPLFTPDKSGHKKGNSFLILATVVLVLFILVSASLAISVSQLFMSGSSSSPNHGDTPVERSQLSHLGVNGTDNTPYVEITGNNDNTNVKVIAELQSELTKLKHQNEALLQTVLREKHETETKLKKIMYEQRRESEEVDLLSSRFNDRMDNITARFQQKSIDSLASCTLKTSAISRVISKGTHVETTFSPGQEELENKFVLFAFCTFLSMADVSLDVQKTGTHAQYRCRCRAIKKGISYKSCTLHYWLCPLS